MKRALILGHRGAPALAPENTLESFRRALKLGADGFEFDVRRSADGRLVVVHDARVGARWVARSTYAELRATRRGAAMPVLEEVLREFGHAWLDIELKVPGIEAPVLDLAAKYCRRGHFVITSFSREVVAQVKALDPDAPVGWLLRRAVPPEAWQELALNYLVPHLRALQPPLVKAARQRGLGLITWTVNASRDLRRALELGVDAVISDFPDRALTLTRGPGR